MYLILPSLSRELRRKAVKLGEDPFKGRMGRPDCIVLANKRTFLRQPLLLSCRNPLPDQNSAVLYLDIQCVALVKPHRVEHVARHGDPSARLYPCMYEPGLPTQALLQADQAVMGGRGLVSHGRSVGLASIVKLYQG